MKHTPLYFAASCLAALPFSTAFAQETAELVTDRPDQTESSVTVPSGSYQLELGWTMTRDERGDMHYESHEVPGTLLRIGLTDRVELRLGWAGQVDEQVEIGGQSFKTDGSGDAELGAKLYLRPESGSSPEVALLLGTTVPVGDDSLTSDRFDPSFRLLFSHSLSDRLDLGYNVGMAFATEPGDDGALHTLSSFNYTLALGIGLTDRLGSFLEFYGDVAAIAQGGPVNAFDAGFTYLLRDNLQLDLAGGVGISDAAEDWFVGLGFTIRLPN